MIILLLIASIISIGGCLYSKRFHDKVFSDDIYPGVDSLSGAVLLFVLVALGFLPWYVMKSVLILSGILIIYWTLRYYVA
ncbi:hypothetical protein QYM26_30145 [Priestia megaterium]|nr:hypothetical protein [Priestia megaterium]